MKQWEIGFPRRWYQPDPPVSKIGYRVALQDNLSKISKALSLKNRSIATVTVTATATATTTVAKGNLSANSILPSDIHPTKHF